MVLLSFVLGAAACGLSAAVAALFFRGPERKQLRLAITIGGMVVLTALGRELILRPREAEAPLQQIPAFRVIKTHEPETYAAVRAELEDLVGKGLDEDAMRARVQQHLVPLAKKYIPRASDEALRRFFSVFVAELDQIRVKDPAVAQRFAFQSQGEPVDIRPYIDPATAQEEVDALGDLIESGAGSLPREDDPQRAQALLSEAMARLVTTHGPAVALLANPAAPDADPTQLTLIVADLYRSLLALPAPDSALVLRHLLAES